MFHEDTVSCTRMGRNLSTMTVGTGGQKRRSTGTQKKKEDRRKKNFLQVSFWVNNDDTEQERRAACVCMHWPLSRNRTYRYGNTPLPLPTTITMVDTYTHTHTCQLQPSRCLSPDGGELHNSLICLWPLKECLKASPIPNGRHQKRERGRGTPSARRHRGCPPFLSVPQIHPPFATFNTQSPLAKPRAIPGEPVMMGVGRIIIIIWGRCNKFTRITASFLDLDELLLCVSWLFHFL